jgi:hypothetical protein
MVKDDWITERPAGDRSLDAICFVSIEKSGRLFGLIVVEIKDKFLYDIWRVECWV